MPHNHRVGSSKCKGIYMHNKKIEKKDNTKNTGSRIFTNKSLGITNDNVCTVNDKVCTVSHKVCTDNDKLCTDSDKLCTDSDRLCTDNIKTCTASDSKVEIGKSVRRTDCEEESDMDLE